MSLTERIKYGSRVNGGLLAEDREYVEDVVAPWEKVSGEQYAHRYVFEGKNPRYLRDSPDSEWQADPEEVWDHMNNALEAATGIDNAIDLYKLGFEHREKGDSSTILIGAVEDGWFPTIYRTVLQEAETE